MSIPSVTITGPRTPHEKANEKKKMETDQNIQVFIRARPLDASRNERKSSIEVDTIRKEVRLPERAGEKGPRIFTYDNVFDASCGQYEIYDNVVSPLVHEVLAGYNCTVFAYGQTGTGKTYTMEGERSDYECTWEEDPKSGIVPRALDQLFELLNESGGEHTVAVSYMELYNENLFDLLAPNDDLVKLNIYEDNLNKGKVKVGGLAEVSVHAKSEIYDILQKGSAKRQTAATKLNACSSRSHTIFAVTVRMKDVVNLMDGEEVYRMGKLNLVDLAGSENIGRSGAVDKRAAEAGNINKSLLTLGRVITSLVDKNSHIPYRESKLTRLLQDSLGGRTKTSIIATISPNAQDLEDSISTLEYAQRAKKITNKPELNQKMTKNTVLKELTAEIERLRRDVEAGRGGTNAFFISKENHESLLEKEKELVLKEQMVKDLEAELEKAKCLFGETQAMLEKKSEMLLKTENSLHDTRSDLHRTKVTLTQVCEQKDEQEFLVKVHVDTEAKLSSQAQQLVSVADTTTDHVQRLHAKIDRVIALEDANMSKASDLVHNFMHEMKTTSELVSTIDTGFLDDTEKRLKQGSTSILSGLDAVVDKLRQIESGLKDQIGSQVQRCSDNDGLFECIEQAMQAVHVVRTEQLTSAAVVRDLLQRQTRDVSSEISQIMRSLALQKAKEEEMLMRQSQLIQESHTIRDHLVSQLKQSITETFAMHQQQLLSFKQQVHDLGTQLTQQSASRRSELKSCMQRMLCEFTAKEQDKETAVQSSVSGITTNMEQQSSDWESGTASACDYVDQKFVLVQANEKERQEHNDGMDQKIAEHFQQRIDQLQSLDSRSQERNQKLETVVESGSQSLAHNVENALAAQSELQQKIADQANDQKNSLQSMERELTMHVTEAGSRVDYTVKHVEDLQSDLSKETIVEKIHIKAVQKDLLEALRLRSQDVCRLTETELQTDVPTGHTPQKVTYQYPKDLVSTSPHERILTRFRQNRVEALAELAVVSELPDEKSEDHNSRPSSAASSTGSDAGIENKQPVRQTSSSSKLPKIKSTGSLPRNSRHKKKLDEENAGQPHGDVLRTQTSN